MGECGASISQTLCIPPDGSRGDHLCVLCSTTYVCVRVCTCMVGARATIVSQALCIFFYPRDQRVSKTPSPNYFPREKNKDREKISRQDIINERTLEREREKKKKSKTSYHHNRRNFRSRNFLTLLASSLLRTHLDPPLRCESQTRPHSIKESHRKIHPPLPLLDPPSSKRIRTRASNPSKRPRRSVPRHVHRLCSLLFSAKGACSRGSPRLGGVRACCICAADVLERRAGRGSAYRCR